MHNVVHSFPVVSHLPPLVYRLEASYFFAANCELPLTELKFGRTKNQPQHIGRNRIRVLLAKLLAIEALSRRLS